MKLAISNIGWLQADDERMYSSIKEYGFQGLEIAPTRIFPDEPYEKPDEAKRWLKELQVKYGLSVPSMQSVWHGRPEKIFGSAKERSVLFAYTKKAIEFAEAIECANLVFGCPGNRFLPEGADTGIAVKFFRELGDYAYMHHTVIAMEANPPVYNTNYINTTEQAVQLVLEVNSKGFLLNLDIGTIIANREPLSVLKGREHLIHHVHISEPGLKAVQERELHRELAQMLREADYQKYVSVETGCQEDLEQICGMMKYVKEIFG